MWLGHNALGATFQSISTSLLRVTMQSYSYLNYLQSSSVLILLTLPFLISRLQWPCIACIFQFRLATKVERRQVYQILWEKITVKNFWHISATSYVTLSRHRVKAKRSKCNKIACCWINCYKLSLSSVDTSLFIREKCFPIQISCVPNVPSVKEPRLQRDFKWIKCQQKIKIKIALL